VPTSLAVSTPPDSLSSRLCTTPVSCFRVRKACNHTTQGGGATPRKGPQLGGARALQQEGLACERGKLRVHVQSAGRVGTASVHALSAICTWWGAKGFPAGVVSATETFSFCRMRGREGLELSLGPCVQLSHCTPQWRGKTEKCNHQSSLSRFLRA